MTIDGCIKRRNIKMSASCNLIGKNEQQTIKNYADWSTGWLKTVSYDLILTIQKLKTICNGEHSSESDSVEYNALCELIGSVYKQLKEKYSDDEIDNTSKYDEKNSVLRRIYDSTVGMKDELKGEKPIKIDTTRLFNTDKKEYHKIVIPGNHSYYRWGNYFNFVNWFYEIDGYIHEYFGDVENPFETEFSLVFNDIDVVKRLNSCVLKDVIFSTKNPTIKKLDNICENVYNSTKLYYQVSILENLRINYPKIKFEYNENTTKEFVLTEEDIIKNKTKRLLD
jgi:hypothetical protein